MGTTEAISFDTILQTAHMRGVQTGVRIAVLAFLATDSLTDEGVLMGYVLGSLPPTDLARNAPKLDADTIGDSVEAALTRLLGPENSDDESRKAQAVADCLARLEAAFRGDSGDAEQGAAEAGS
jgi:hypothetical protein